MKYILIFLFLPLSNSSEAQCDSSLVGKWKLVSYFNGEVYFNLKTDSTYLSPEIIASHPDKSEQQQFIQRAKDFFGNFVYVFGVDGRDSFFIYDRFQYDGTHCFIPSRGILQQTSKNSLGEDVTEDIKATLKDGLLYMSPSLESTEVFDLGFEKVK